MSDDHKKLSSREEAVVNIMAGFLIKVVEIVVNGFIIYCLWPDVVLGLFPGLVQSGAIAKAPSVPVCMIAYVLIRFILSAHCSSEE